MNGDERLSAWRSYRKTFPKDGTIETVLTDFSGICLRTRYLDYYTPKSWPNSFEIVYEGMLCQSGLTIILAKTLEYLGFINPEAHQFDAISNHITGVDGLVLVNNNMCYNFLPGEAVARDAAPASTCRIPRFPRA